ncbi:MAG: hypothetical protein ACRCTD_15125 [Beijerinckiaceae bacterium]
MRVPGRGLMGIAGVVALCGPALAQVVKPADYPAVAPVIETLLKDEAELAGAARAGDAARLKKLQWRNIATSFAFARNDPPIKPDDAEATALRKAYVTCAEAHGLVGMVSGIGFRAITSNVGGESTELENITARESMNFFLKPFHEKRQTCVALTGVAVTGSPLPAEADGMLPAFRATHSAPLSPHDMQALTASLLSMDAVEHGVARAVADQSAEPLNDLAPRFAVAFSLMARLRDATGSRRAQAALSECDWAMRFVFELTNGVHQGLVRPDIRQSAFANAREPLGDYRRTKAQCASALDAPKKDGLARLQDDFTLAAAP